MCYDNKCGAFDFTYEEYKMLYDILDSRIMLELQDEEYGVDKQNPHKFLQYQQLRAKLEGVIYLMDTKENKKNQEIEF